MQRFAPVKSMIKEVIRGRSGTPISKLTSARFSDNPHLFAARTDSAAGARLAPKLACEPARYGLGCDYPIASIMVVGDFSDQL